MQRRGEERTKVIVRSWGDSRPKEKTDVVDAVYYVLWKPDTSVPWQARQEIGETTAPVAGDKKNMRQTRGSSTSPSDP